MFRQKQERTFSKKPAEIDCLKGSKLLANSVFEQCRFQKVNSNECKQAVIAYDLHMKQCGK